LFRKKYTIILYEFISHKLQRHTGRIREITENEMRTDTEIKEHFNMVNELIIN